VEQVQIGVGRADMPSTIHSRHGAAALNKMQRRANKLCVGRIVFGAASS
jgi:hypothetical protein